MLLLQKLHGVALTPLPLRPTLPELVAFLTRTRPAARTALLTTLASLTRLSAALSDASSANSSLSALPPADSRGDSVPPTTGKRQRSGTSSWVAPAMVTPQSVPVPAHDDVDAAGVAAPSVSDRASAAAGASSSSSSASLGLASPAAPLLRHISRIASAHTTASSLLQEEILHLLSAERALDIFKKLEASLYEITQMNYVSLDTSTSPTTAYISSFLLELMTRWIVPLQRQSLCSDSQPSRPRQVDYWTEEPAFPSTLDILPDWPRIIHHGWAHAELRSLHPLTAMAGVESAAALVLATTPSDGAFDPSQLWLREEAFYRRLARSLLPIISREFPPESPTMRNWKTFVTKADHGWKLSGPAAPADRVKRAAAVVTPCAATALIDKALARSVSFSSPASTQQQPRLSPPASQSQQAQSSRRAPAPVPPVPQPTRAPAASSRTGSSRAAAAPSPVASSRPAESRVCASSKCAKRFQLAEGAPRHLFCSLDCRKEEKM